MIENQSNTLTTPVETRPGPLRPLRLRLRNRQPSWLRRIGPLYLVLVLVLVTMTACNDGSNDTPQGNSPGPMLNLEPFVVNLNEELENDARYLRLIATLELEDAATEADIASRVTIIRDVFISHLASQQSDILRSTQDKDRLKGELLELARTATDSDSIRSVYFTEFIIQ